MSERAADPDEAEVSLPSPRYAPLERDAFGRATQQARLGPKQLRWLARNRHVREAIRSASRATERGRRGRADP